MSSQQIILLDADGVVQNPHRDWEQALTELCGGEQNLKPFLEDVFRAEEPFLTGEPGFPAALEVVLNRWNRRALIQDALHIWTLIEPVPEILALVEYLRRRGTKVFLASNQERYRADYMTKEIGYEEKFDALFYSCDLGHVKPSTEYFHEIANRLQVELENLLLIDDNKDNVETAISLGMNAEVFDSTEGIAVLRELLINNKFLVKPISD
jgi:putative hydrolase of the HAD superfamily